jgi:superfamily II DNA helicase RecQ
MLFQAWRVPVIGGDAVLRELNAFAVKHRILELERRFVEAGLDSFWAIWMCYESLQAAPVEAAGKGAARDRVDYRTILSEEDFSVFARLRSLRKRLADQEGVPVYSIFNNKQLALLVTERVSTAAGLQQIRGVGGERLAKYGDVFLSELRTIWSAGDSVKSEH